MMTPDERRASWTRATTAKLQAGYQIESDPIFRHWIQEWVDGVITMQTVRDRYKDLLAARLGRRVKVTEDATDHVLEDFPEVSGLKLRSSADRQGDMDAINHAWDDQ